MKYNKITVHTKLYLYELGECYNSVNNLRIIKFYKIK
jgi:hypothetical protein